MALRVRVLRFVLLVLVGLVFSSGSISLASDNGVEVVKKVEPSIGYVKTYDNFGRPLATGSGFFIDTEGCFITNRHVIDNAAMTVIEMSDGRTFGVRKVKSVHPEIDLVKLEIDTKGTVITPLALANQAPDKGETVYAFGNPQNLKFTVSDGIVSGLQQIPEISKYHPYIQFTSPISPGSSGGPLVNSQGEVVGIVVMTKLSGQNLNFAIPVGTIEQLVDTNAIVEAVKPEPKPNTKPKIALFAVGDTRITENEKCKTIIANRIKEKFDPVKYEVIDDSAKLSTNFRGFLEDNGIVVRSGERPVINDYPKVVLEKFGKNYGYDYVVGIVMKVGWEDNGDSMSRPAQAKIDMDVKYLDINKGKLVFFETLSETGKHFDMWLGTKWRVALERGVTKVMDSFRAQVPSP